LPGGLLDHGRVWSSDPGGGLSTSLRWHQRAMESPPDRVCQR
jgi:biotin-(acetyl-CoA carboxylase) ligase